MTSNKEFYNSLSSEYDEMIDIRSSIENKGKLLAGFIKKDDKVADVGCGIGIDSITASKLGAVVDAFDPSEKMIAQAKNNAKLFDVKFSAYNYSASEIPDIFFGKYDLVISLGNTFANIPNIEFDKSLVNLVKLIKPGGKIIIHLLNYSKILRDKERIVNITGKGKFQFVRFYDFAESELQFNILRFEKENLSNYRLLSTNIYPYTFEDFASKIEQIRDVSIEVFGTLKLEKYKPNDSKNLVAIISKQ